MQKRWVWAGVGIACIWAMLSANPAITVASILLLPTMVMLVWRSGEPPALMYICMFQWLQASTAIFYADFYQTSLVQAFGEVELERATWLSLAGVFALAIGMRIALIWVPASREERHESEALTYNLGRLFLAYVVAFTISYIGGELAVRIPAVAQVLFAVASIKWTVAFMLLYAAAAQGRGYVLASAALLIEFASGILGYFAGFKGMFFVLLIVALTPAMALRGKRLIVICATAAALVFSGVLWTAVKSDYRDFLSQGLQSQEILVPVEERVGKLGDLIAQFRWEQMGEATEALLLRLSYVQYFALTIVNVPSNVAYENGALWLGALDHVFKPRILFPNKAALDDSARASLYTGMEVAGTERGTSIGIGYMAESYVDFGPVFMFLPIFLLGAFYGFIYRQFVIRSRYALIGCGIATAILVFGGNAIETSNIKIVGGNVMALLVLGGFYFLFAGRLHGWLKDTDE